MKKIFVLMVLILGVSLGFIGSVFVGADANYESPLSVVTDREKVSPSDIIKEHQIMVYKDKVVIHINEPQWAAYTDTNSMDPVIDAGANGLEFIPRSPEDINVGDIATYESDEGLIIHRVVDKTYENGTYMYKFKGDNNPYSDGWVEFEDVKYVTWGVIY